MIDLKHQSQGLFEFWGYDAVDAAEEWWLSWGIFGERELEKVDDLGNLSGQDAEEVIDRPAGPWLQVVETVVEG